MKIYTIIGFIFALVSYLLILENSLTEYLLPDHQQPVENFEPQVFEETDEEEIESQTNKYPRENLSFLGHMTSKSTNYSFHLPPPIPHPPK